MGNMIFKNYAMSDNAQKFANINRATYNKIKQDGVVEYERSGRHYDEYKIIDRKGLTDDEIAIIASGGGLHFGYSMSGSSVNIFTG